MYASLSRAGDPPPSITWWSGSQPLRVSNYKPRPARSARLCKGETSRLHKDSHSSSFINSFCGNETLRFSTVRQKKLPEEKMNWRLNLKSSQHKSEDIRGRRRKSLDGGNSNGYSVNSGRDLLQDDSDHDEYWSDAMKVINSREEEHFRSKEKRKFFMKELRLSNITKNMIRAGNITCRATNNPELKPATTTLQLVQFGK